MRLFSDFPTLCIMFACRLASADFQSSLSNVVEQQQISQMFSAEQQSSSNSVSRRAVLLHPKVVSQGEQLTPKPSSVPVLRCMLFFCLLATNYLAQQHRVGEEQSRLIGSTKKNAITLFFTLPIKCGQTTFAGAAARPLLQSLHLYQPLRKGKVTSLDQARENDMKTKLCIIEHLFTPHVPSQ